MLNIGLHINDCITMSSNFKCCVASCKNNKYNVKKLNAKIFFHKFPDTVEIRQKWIEFCRKETSWVPSPNNVVCSQHFILGDYQLGSTQVIKRGSNLLKPEAIPSIMLGENVHDAVLDPFDNKETKQYVTLQGSYTKQIEDTLHSCAPDYQLSKLPFHQKHIALRRLYSNAIPANIDGKPVIGNDNYSCDETETQKEIDPMLLEYRDQFCRTCLRHCQGELLTSVNAQIRNMTVLEMLIQLTDFETENNVAFPTVICLECKHKLEQAFSVRQELIVQSELLVQLVAEQKILEFFKNVLDDPLASSGPSAPEEYIFTDTNQAYSLSSDGLFSNDSEISNSFQVTQNQVPREEKEKKMSIVNDHSCYTKAKEQHNHANAANKLGACEENSAADVRAVCAERCKPDIEQSEGADSSVYCKRIDEREKVSAKAREAALRRTRTKKQCKALIREKGSLKAKTLISNSFPFTTCYICDTKHDSLMERDFHMREHVWMLPYTCAECTGPRSNDDACTGARSNDDIKTTDNVSAEKPKVLKSTNQLNLHFRMHRLPHKCEKCNHRSSCTTKLKYHFQAVHVREESVMTCEYCGKQYFDKTIFRTHVAHHRNEQNGQFKCTICDRSFGVKSSLQRHEASHKGEKKHKCLYCDKSFSTSYNRLQHQRTHTGERPYGCPDCGRSFSQSTTLKAHRKAFHMFGSSNNSKPYKPSSLAPVLLPSNGNRCPYAGCNYTASTYAAMYVHKRTKHKPVHCCSVCGKSFAFANQLKTHFMLHTGEKPLQCTMCERRFRLMKDYRWHMETHSSDISFSCTICHKSFKLRRYLEAHMLTHTAVHKFVCGICGKSYKTKGELKKHSQQKHSDEKADHHFLIKEDDLAMDVPSDTFYVSEEENGYADNQSISSMF